MSDPHGSDRAATRNRRSASDNPSIEGLVRELAARFDGLELRVTETRDDAREARDAATRLTERLGAQDTPAQLEKLRSEMTAGFVAARSDLVNATDRMTTEHRGKVHDLEARLEAHHKRLESLEGFRNKALGAGGLFTWLSKNAPWLVALLFALAAAVGFKDKLP